MNENIKSTVLAKIREYDRIIISRHIRPDGDAVGSTKGLQRILSLSFPEKKVLCINADTSEYLSFLGPEDADTDKAEYENSLMIVLDTATEDRISNPLYKACREVVKIDHHIDIKPYGDLSWVEDGRSSVCEMIADFYITFSDELKIDSYAATCLYTGMVTDSGRFRYSSTSGETLRCAAVLLECGIDTDTLFANLYLSNISELKFKAYVLNQINITENGVAYIRVTEDMQKLFGLSGEAASNVISYLDSIKNSIIWLAFIENPDGSLRVRLRSRFVTVSELAQKYGGGGHAFASGATVNSIGEEKSLLGDADELIREYKATHDGWL